MFHKKDLSKISEESSTRQSPPDAVENTVNSDPMQSTPKSTRKTNVRTQSPSIRSLDPIPPPLEHSSPKTAANKRNEKCFEYSAISDFSFKTGDSALRMIDADHENLLRNNQFMIPVEISFRPSLYPAQYSWEEAALANSPYQQHHPTDPLPPTQEQEIQQQQNETREWETKSPRTTSFLKNLSQISIFDQTTQMEQTLDKNNAQPVLSFDQNIVFFGFCAVGWDEEMVLSVQNISEKDLLLKSAINVSSNDKLTSRMSNEKEFDAFKLVNAADERGVVVGPDKHHDIVLQFHPSKHDQVYTSTLYVKAHTRTETHKYKFKIFGYGGKAIVRPKLTPGMAISFNYDGRYLYAPKNHHHFKFELENAGGMAAFACIEVFFPDGRPVPPKYYTLRNMNTVLGPIGDKYSTMDIEFHFNEKALLGTNVDELLTASNIETASNPKIQSQNPACAFIFAVFWGEEGERTRIALLEEKLRKSQLCFGGRDFVHPIVEFSGLAPADTRKLKDTDRRQMFPHISKDDLSNFESHLRVFFIEVLNKRRLNTASVTASRSSTNSSFASRTPSTVSLASVGSSRPGTSSSASSQQRQNCWYELEPENTLMRIDEDVEDTLIASDET